MTQTSLETSPFVPSSLRRAGKISAGVGLISLSVCLIVWISLMISGHLRGESAAAFYKAYLFAWLFLLGVSLGAMMAVMIHHLTGGNWGYFVRRFGEAAACVLPLLFVLFVPVLCGLQRIYPWADPNNHNAVVAHKHAYLNPGFFVLRYVIYFAIWSSIAWLLRALSLKHDRTNSQTTEISLRRLSAVGLVLYFVTMSLASVDWVMSLEPNWYSTVFGFIVCMGQAVEGVCLLIIMLELMSRQLLYKPLLQPKHFNDLATLLITAVILWAYTSFSQLLVVWMGNIQDEIPWYVARSYGAWRIISILLIFAGFLAPFVLLLQRGVKKHGKALLWLCVGILAMQALDTFWWIAPAGADPFPHVNWLNVAMSVVALVGIGGVWFAVFIWILNRAPLVPRGDAVPINGPEGKEVPELRNSLNDAKPGTQPGLA